MALVTAEELGQVPFLQGLEPSVLARLARRARQTDYPAGAQVFQEGDAIEEYHFLAHGRVALIMIARNGVERVTGLITPAELLNAIYPGRDRNLKHALCLVPTRIYSVPTEWVLELARGELELAFRLLQYFSFRIGQLSRQFMDQTGRPARERVAQALLLVRESLESDQLPLTQSVLADLAGCTRVTAAHVLREFRDAGWLVTGRGRLELRDPEALRQLIV